MKRTQARFGLTDSEWEEAKAELRAAIMEAARERRMTSYSDVASKVSSVRVDAHSALMSHLLGEIFEDETAADRPALTAIVTHKNGDMEPGPGFYEMARRLGYSVPDPVVFWAQQVQEVFKMYG